MVRQLADKDPPASRARGFAQRVARLWGGADRDLAGPWLPKDTGYPRLRELDVVARGLTGQSGLYACWHLGVRPQWVRVGAATDLGTAIVRLQQHVEIMGRDANGGLFVAWALSPADTLPGVVGFLAEHLKPVLQSRDVAGEIAPGAVDTAFPLPPGTHLPVRQPAKPQL